MKVKTGRIRIGAAAAVATLASAVLLTGCADPKPHCTTQQPMFYSTTDHHYHYGSPTGSTVPGYAVPKSAQKVKGYKVPPGTAIAPKSLNKSSSKTGTKTSSKTVKAPSKPRTGRR